MRYVDEARSRGSKEIENPSSQEFFQGASIIVALSAEASFRAVQDHLSSTEAR